MSRIFEYRSTRALQICVVFVTTLVLERMLNYSRAGWIGFIVMMIYVGFDSGASIHRTMHRFWGTVLGLILSYFLWQLGLLDFRLMLTVIPIVIFLSFFTLSQFYAYPTIFMVSLTFLGTAYFNPSDTSADNFFSDYFKSTLAAFFICLMFEGLIFRKSNLTIKFYDDLQKSIILELESLYFIGMTVPANQNLFLRSSALCQVKMNELHDFEKTAQHDLGLEEHGLGNTESFHALVSRILHDIHLLFLLSAGPGSELALSIRLMLASLQGYLCQEGS